MCRGKLSKLQNEMPEDWRTYCYNFWAHHCLLVCTVGSYALLSVCLSACLGLWDLRCAPVLASCKSESHWQVCSLQHQIVSFNGCFCTQRLPVSQRMRSDWLHYLKSSERGGKYSIWGAYKITKWNVIPLKLIETRIFECNAWDNSPEIPLLEIVSSQALDFTVIWETLASYKSWDSGNWKVCICINTLTISHTR